MKLGKKVAYVETQEPHIGAGGVSVVTDDGHRQTFDGVVMTTPLGWLKRNTGGFAPSLDRRLLDAIDSISVGHLEKVSPDLQISARASNQRHERSTSNSLTPTGKARILSQLNTPPPFQFPKASKMISPAMQTG